MMAYDGFLLGGAMSILKNDGVRQWEDDYPIYEMENKIHVWNHQPEHLHLQKRRNNAPGSPFLTPFLLRIF